VARADGLATDNPVDAAAEMRAAPGERAESATLAPEDNGRRDDRQADGHVGRYWDAGRLVEGPNPAQHCDERTDQREADSGGQTSLQELTPGIPDAVLHLLPRRLRRSLSEGLHPPRRLGWARQKASGDSTATDGTAGPAGE
jgi:hypothetical protein